MYVQLKEALLNCNHYGHAGERRRGSHSHCLCLPIYTGWDGEGETEGGQEKMRKVGRERRRGEKEVKERKSIRERDRK